MSRYPRNFIAKIQRKVAVSAIPASALRAQGAPGVVRATRDFLTDTRLLSFTVRNEATFARRLDATTRSLCSSLPRRACAWGTGRKAINLFLRDALYNVYLTNEFELSRMEPFLEIPLDSYVARYIRSHFDGRLPRWRGVRALDVPTSAAYQAAARAVAAKRGLPRVHLDAYIWADPDRDAT
jgi:hypothetical protein